MPVKTARIFKKRKMTESRRTPSGGRGSREGCRRIGINAATEVIRGMTAFKMRYIVVEEESIASAARLYKAALTPLKLTVSDIAKG